MPKYILIGISYKDSEEDVFEYLREEIELLSIRGLRNGQGENKGIFIVETEYDVFEQLTALCSEEHIRVSKYGEKTSFHQPKLDGQSIRREDDEFGRERDIGRNSYDHDKISENTVPRRKRISFVGMDGSEEDPTDYTYRDPEKKE